MAQHFEKLTEAKKEYKVKTNHDYKDRGEYGCLVKIYNRNKGRRRRKEKLLKKPYFVGTYLEWLNLY